MKLFHIFTGEQTLGGTYYDDDDGNESANAAERVEGEEGEEEEGSPKGVPKRRKKQPRMG